ncbi:MAG: hypothetical protein PHP54_02535 [Clostridia bacterium]|nr:hypothetical protein [Clostridia bacterium]
MIETVADLGSTVFSIGNMLANPSWGNLGFMLWDIASVFIPAVPGSYVARAVNAVNTTIAATISIVAINDLYQSTVADTKQSFSNTNEDIRNKIESIPLNPQDIQSNIESFPTLNKNINSSIQSFPLQERQSNIESFPLTSIGIGDRLIVDNFKEAEKTNIMEFNPGGRLGGTLHRNMVDEVINDIRKRGLGYDTEYGVDTTKVERATKNHRYLDAVALDKDGNVVEMYQVGRENKNGTPVSRERKAIYDIENAVRFNDKIRNQTKVKFVKYN